MNCDTTRLHRILLYIKYPDANMVRQLLERQEVDLDIPDVNTTGKTALMTVCHRYQRGTFRQRYHQNLEIISIFLEYGCNVHLRDLKDHTALFYAITTWGGDTSVIDLLISHGADINDCMIPPLSRNMTRDEETIQMLIYYGADPRHLFYEAYPHTSVVIARECTYPFVSLCDLEVLRHTDLSTLHDIWPYQDKELFSQWCLEQDLEQLIHAVFSTAHKTCLGIEVFSRLLYAFFDERLLDETMYYRATSEIILNLLPQFKGYHLDDSDMADILRILLSNTNCIQQSVVEYFQAAFRDPRGIIKVLEDFNVLVVDDYNLNQRKTKSYLLWRMYTSNTFQIREIDKFEVVCELLTLSKYYHFNSLVERDGEESFLFPDRGCTLVELCRNKIRQMCQMVRVDKDRPFAYASRIKALLIPERLKQVMLLRQTLYLQTNVFLDRRPIHSSRW